MKKKKVKKSIPKSRTVKKKIVTKKDEKPDDFRTPRNLTIVYSKLLFPNKYKEANKWLLDQEIKIGKSQYYEIIKEMETTAFSRLSNRGKNYLSIVADMGDKLELFHNKIIEELQKKKPNPVIINGFTQLIKIQPLFSAFDRQVKNLMEKVGEENKLLKV